MSTNEDFDKTEGLKRLRDAWKKSFWACTLDEEFGDHEIEAYWQIVICSMGLHLAGIRKMLGEMTKPETPLPNKLSERLEKLEKAYELCVAIGDFLLEISPTPPHPINS